MGRLFLGRFLFWFGFYFVWRAVCAPQTGCQTGAAFATDLLVFFLSECTLVMEMEISSLFVHINTCFSGEAFLIHSLFLHSDAKLVKFKTWATGCLFSVGLQAGVARTDPFSWGPRPSLAQQELIPMVVWYLQLEKHPKPRTCCRMLLGVCHTRYVEINSCATQV